ncbi:MAG: MFS transporter, partial [Streptomycetaceae bacterium]
MTLQRDRVFWTVGFQVAIINIYLGGFGPAQPLLRAQQHTSLTVAGLHGTSMGIAAILAGFVNPHLTHRFGRQITSWIGFAFFCFGVLMFVVCPPVLLTLLATLIGGFGVSTIINTMVTQLSDHFPNDASDAVSQASGISSGGYIIGTLSIGAIASTSLSWRLGLLSVIPLSLLLYFYARPHISKEHVPHEDGPERGAMSVKFWIAWIGFIACISTEFGTTFWAAALVQDRVRSTPAISTLSMLAFGIGMAMGRWYGPHVLRRFSLDSQLKTVLVFQ